MAMLYLAVENFLATVKILEAFQDIEMLHTHKTTTLDTMKLAYKAQQL